MAVHLDSTSDDATESFAAVLGDLVTTARENAQIYLAAAALCHDGALGAFCRESSEAYEQLAAALQGHARAMHHRLHRRELLTSATAALAAAALEELADDHRVAGALAAMEERTTLALDQACADARSYDTIQRLLLSASERSNARRARLREIEVGDA